RRRRASPDLCPRARSTPLRSAGPPPPWRRRRPPRSPGASGRPLPRGARDRRRSRHASTRRPLPRWTCEALRAHAQATGIRRAFPRCDRDVPRDGHDVLAGEGRDGNEGVGVNERRLRSLESMTKGELIAEITRLREELEEQNRALTVAHEQVTETLEQQKATSEIIRVT